MSRIQMPWLMSHEPASNYRFVETNQPLILYSRSHFQIFTPHPLILLLQRRTALQNKVKLYRYHITCKAILCIYISTFPIFSHSPHSSIIPPRQRMLNGCLFRCPVSRLHEPAPISVSWIQFHIRDIVPAEHIDNEVRRL